MNTPARLDEQARESAQLVAYLLRALLPCTASTLACNGRYLRPRYTHMGALLADTALQAGLNYATVVRPRVESLIAAFPNASSISELQQLLLKTPATVLLRWNHPDKVRRFLDLVGLCAACSVETLDDFQGWIITTAAVTKLHAIHGIGPKSIDYLIMLAGHPAVPMDRHLFRFVAFAGVSTKNYEIAQRAFTDGCAIVGLDMRDAEHQLWILMQSTQAPSPAVKRNDRSND